MYDFMIIMYTNFKFVDGFYMMIRFYDNNDIIWWSYDNFIWLYMIWFWWCHDVAYWYIYIYIIWWYYKLIYYMMVLYDDEMSWGHGDGYVVLWAPMDGSVIEAAYGETIIHSTKAVWEILAREEWLGCRHDTSPMVDILGPTLVWAPYMIFFWFSWYKNLYVLCF